MPMYPIRRRPRECKTCLPCRASKVRCDRNVPCSNCVKRNFTCSYGRPPAAAKLPVPVPVSASTTPSQLLQPSLSLGNSPSYDASAPPPPPPQPPHSLAPRDGSYPPDQSGPASVDADLPEVIDISQEEWDEINTKMVATEQILGSLHSIFNSHSSRKRSEATTTPSEGKDSNQSEGVYGSNVMRTGDVHFGSRSALAHILDKFKGSDDTTQALPQEDLLAELALGNESAAYPFADLWSSDPSYTFNIAGVCGVLPDDEQCKRYVA